MPLTEVSITWKGEMVDTDSESFGMGGVNTILPEFYYDLLSRILPGSASLLAVLVAAGVVKPAIALERMLTLTSAPVVALYLALGTAGYIIGMVLTYFQWRIRWLYIPGVWRPLLRVYKPLILNRESELGPTDFGDDIELALAEQPSSNNAVRKLVPRLYGPLHDLLKEHHPQARFVLPKMNGEAGLCDNLAVGFLSASLVLCCRVVFRVQGLQGFWRSSEMWSVLGLWLAVILFFLVARHRYRALIQRHFSYWSVLPKENVGAV